MSILPAPRARGLAAAVCSLALLAACSGDGVAPAPALSPAAGAARSQHVDVAPSDVVLMVRTPTAAVGERGETSMQLDAGIFNRKGKIHPHMQEKFYVWVTSDPDVATVDTTGLVTAVGVGTASIIVDYKDMADTISVAVIPVPVASVTASGPDSLSIGDTAMYTAAALDSVGEPLVGRTITWSSSDPAALPVGATDGVAVAQAVGTALVTATSDGKSGTVTTKVWLQPIASIDVTPASATVALYRAAPTFTATPRDRRGNALTGRVVTWRASDPATFAIDALTGATITLAPGAGDAIAESEGKSGTGHLVVTNPVEARALWVNRFDYASAANIATVMQRAAQAHFNIVYFQVRGHGDAFYRSSIEPCAYSLCGTLGGGTVNVTPPYDPLAVAVSEAAKYGIEVHAWLNANTGWVAGNSTNCNKLIESTPRHMLKAHPDWIMLDRAGTAMPCLTSSEYIWVSPGIPGVRTQLARVAADIVRRYGVKGVHLDRIRYPGTTWSYDTVSVNAWDRANNLAMGTLPASSSAAWADFRRAYVNAEVREVRDSLNAINPSLVLSAAVWPIYKTPAGWSTGFSRGYDDLFQDTRNWTANGILDVAAPMTYPGSATSVSYIIKPTYCASLDWLCLFDDHRAVIENRDHRHMYIGVGAIRGWPDMAAEIEAARARGATGMSVYNYGTVNAIANAWSLLGSGYFRYPATIPPMAWKP